MGSFADLRKHLRPLDWVLLAVLASAVLLLLLEAGFYLVRWTEPFPPFGKSILDQRERWITPVLGGLWLAWAAQTLWRAGRRGLNAPSLLIVYFFSLLAVYVASLGWEMGLPLLNGLFDFGPQTPTEVSVHEWREHTIHGYRYGDSSYVGAVVSRVDHPAERVGISWQGCELPKSLAPSPHATIVMGRGAFGAAWYQPRIACKPLQIEERALFDSFRVGRGRPIAIFALADNYRDQDERDRAWDLQRRNLVDTMTKLADGKAGTVEEGVKDVKRYTDFFEREELATLNNILDGLFVGPESKHRKVGQQALAHVKWVIDLHSEEAVVAPWVQTLEKSALDPEIVMVRYAHHRALPRGISCPRCRPLLDQDLDKKVLRLLLGDQALRPNSQETIFVADGKGHRLFQAGLTEAGRIPELAQALAAPAAP